MSVFNYKKRDDVLMSAAVPHDRVPFENEGPSMTKQEFAEEADINVLMARYEKTGIPPWDPLRPMPQYVDAGEIPSLQDAMQVMIEAEAAFMSLPAKVRKEFDNDPMQFVDAIHAAATSWRAICEWVQSRVRIISPISR